LIEEVNGNQMKIIGKRIGKKITGKITSSVA